MRALAAVVVADFTVADISEDFVTGDFMVATTISFIVVFLTQALPFMPTHIHGGGIGTTMAIIPDRTTATMHTTAVPTTAAMIRNWIRFGGSRRHWRGAATIVAG